MRRVSLLAIALFSAAAACGDDSGGAAGAGTCAELVEASASTTREILEDVAGLTLAELASENPDDPFAPLNEPYAEFEERAQQLGCGREELTRLACEAYAPLVAEADGEVAEEFLSEYFADCD